MKCQNCSKNRTKTFRRLGGQVEIKTGMTDITGYDSICLSCIKKRFATGSFIKGPIITNPTIIPSGEPLEWVLNEE